MKLRNSRALMIILLLLLIAVIAMSGLLLRQNTVGSIVIICLAISGAVLCLSTFFIRQPERTAVQQTPDTEAPEINEDDVNNERKMLEVIKTIALKMIEAEVNDFEGSLRFCMDLLTTTIDADMMRVWKNYKDTSGELYCMLIKEWRSTSGLADKSVFPNYKTISYERDIPHWKEAFLQGKYINEKTKDFGMEERAFLGKSDIESILAIPVLISDELWGFMTFSVFRRERLLRRDEIGVTLSGAMLIGNALQRNTILDNLLSATEHAEEEAIAKTVLLASVSTEMQPPLNSIVSITETMLRSERFHGDDFDNLRKINGSAVSLSLMSDRLMEMSNNAWKEHYKDYENEVTNLAYYETLERAYIPYARVLVVDDIETNLKVNAGLLSLYGVTVDCVMSGTAAIDAISSEQVKYNAIFMDYMMPGLDGIETTRIIRERIGTEYAKTIPIIAVTANDVAGKEEMFLKSGFQAFLAKPLDVAKLDEVVNSWVRDMQFEKTMAEKNSQANSVTNKQSGAIGEKTDSLRQIEELNNIGINTENAIKRLGGDEAVYFEVTKTFAHNTRDLLEKIRECKREDLAEYAIIVHGIKSSASSIGADKLSEKAKALEFAARDNDFGFVAANHTTFMNAADELVTALLYVLPEQGNIQGLPIKEIPDMNTLKALLEACRSYDLDGVDQAMDELDQYSYKSQQDLITWLRGRKELMELKQIAERLTLEIDCFCSNNMTQK